MNPGEIEEKRAFYVRMKLDRLKQGDIYVVWCGSKLTEDEYKEGLVYYEQYKNKPGCARLLEIYSMRKPKPVGF